MPKIKDLPKIERPREKLEKTCAICGKVMEITLYPDKKYRGGHYFFKLPKKREYWECEKCYRKK